MIYANKEKKRNYIGCLCHSKSSEYVITEGFDVCTSERKQSDIETSSLNLKVKSDGQTALER